MVIIYCGKLQEMYRKWRLNKMCKYFQILSIAKLHGVLNEKFGEWTEIKGMQIVTAC